MEDQLQAMKKEASDLIPQVQDLDDLQGLRVKFLGKKGKITEILRGMGQLTQEERPVIGKLANEIRAYLEDLFLDKEKLIKESVLKARLENEKIDVTLPGFSRRIGAVHPLNRVVEELEDIFIGLGFSVAEGPEVETDLYNFEALNLPPDHPARDMQDTFYITPDILLRTHTSAVQIRTLESLNGNVPVRIISHGKVYRRDNDDSTHSHQFTQMEGLVVDKKVTMGELKGILFTFIQQFFGRETKIRLRPSYFPFTEPSVEVDIYRPGKGWLEILGAGMVHPNVLNRVGYDAEKVSGFAFGVGIERLVMLKYGVDDIRHLYHNDLRFLQQFRSV